MVFVSRNHDPRGRRSEIAATFSDSSGVLLWHRLKSYWAAKRALDVAFSGSVLFLLLPLFGLIALAIKLSSRGPVLYRQLRFGFGGEPFEIFKFRSMFIEACDGTATLQTCTDDPRVTPLGRILRDLDIDEYPQLLNVLRGEMSLVGPRPHPVGMKLGDLPYCEIVPDYHARFAVLPGLTGLAQINGWRGPVEDRDHALNRHAWDVLYAQQASLRLDVAIILRTLTSHLRLWSPQRQRREPLEWVAYQKR